jgi:hypothetical protein
MQKPDKVNFVLFAFSEVGTRDGRPRLADGRRKSDRGGVEGTRNGVARSPGPYVECRALRPGWRGGKKDLYPY